MLSNFNPDESLPRGGLKKKQYPPVAQQFVECDCPGEGSSEKSCCG